jgi:hypothetical protein
MKNYAKKINGKDTNDLASGLIGNICSRDGLENPNIRKGNFVNHNCFLFGGDSDTVRETLKNEGRNRVGLINMMLNGDRLEYDLYLPPASVLLDKMCWSEDTKLDCVARGLSMLPIKTGSSELVGLCQVMTEDIKKYKYVPEKSEVAPLQRQLREKEALIEQIRRLVS